MDDKQILQEITKIIREVLDHDDIILTRETEATDVEDWDSTAHIRIMVAIEEAFGIRFETDELSDIPNVGALIDIVSQKLAKK